MWLEACMVYKPTLSTYLRLYPSSIYQVKVARSPNNIQWCLLPTQWALSSREPSPLGRIWLLELVETKGLIVVRLFAVAFAPAPDTARDLGRPRLILRQRRRAGELAAGCVGRTLVEIGMSVPDIFEMVHLVGVR